MGREWGSSEVGGSHLSLDGQGQSQAKRSTGGAAEEAAPSPLPTATAQVQARDLNSADFPPLTRFFS